MDDKKLPDITALLYPDLMFENLSDPRPEEEVCALPYVNCATFPTTTVTTASNEEHENDAE
eukprot:10617695-Ditylum_brightwellii.AAC.1